jgi:O-6-methylguanine DNA methyltransferase
VPEAHALRAQLEAYLRGQRATFSIALDLTTGTAFQRSVWRALQRIPYGATKSYGEIAREIGSPGAARAVGMACGRNPIPILVPCHRVVAHGHKLGGFSAGLHWKKRLLALEEKA